jgi:hypothetical protein
MELRRINTTGETRKPSSRLLFDLFSDIKDSSIFCAQNVFALLSIRRSLQTSQDMWTSYIDTGRGANWAVDVRPVSRRRGVYIIEGSDNRDVDGEMAFAQMSSAVGLDG